ncbi:MAG: hypothetical protein Q4E24_10200 [bacterium]|nr:hypothetical protein [bacterium]
MTIEERVALYKSLFPECKAFSPMRRVIIAKGYRKADTLQRMELLRELDTELAKAYKVRIPVVTFFVRDNNYVAATQEIYLAEPDLEGFLHQFRHHLQNEARQYERRLLLMEGIKGLDDRIPYKEANSLLSGEDDAIAWAKFIIESV